ncbi:crossover junction endodeoxyribonuclease RuvC [Alicyclobacillus acidoterrestris]|uniref:Crossover junction endodeoxyribonuclease RuvC n=1 Tax=Alicyclobacillus acidoterrestris (strain ATCC 49025 / DSM 3922 / CIP 106132 / NCIMB 13137 / GD3B) TaxID=1356854 RepID=T0D8D5_ALIAG|nr:crossover junction endodeoxyribonuclease RuvC [Alicyclobacillus acidoterrestris]EPZ47767.1 hypothetical protein N007_05800 [Alicyclobacillus acidoterrestris ATCC 49025]UNO47930.1 crossover junction endodeoxyribonuclease RuvC [Alicyclobacillus acidoterrestris]
MTDTQQPYYILAIDPSLNRTGYCLARVTPQRHRNKVELVEISYIPNIQFGTGEEVWGRKLNHIESRLVQLRNTYRPVVVAKENLATRSHGQTEVLAPVHGIIRKVFESSCEIVGYSPTRIKKDASVSGNADKKQVEQSIAQYIQDKVIVQVDDDVDLTKFRSDDESDACAILLTYLLDKEIIGKLDKR